MRIYHTEEEFHPEQGCVAALGMFDGVHLGHARLIEQAVKRARALHVPAAAVTFDRHPLSLLAPERTPPLLSCAGEKEARMAELGLDVLIERPFTRAYADQTPEHFLEALCRALRPRALVAGYNYSFGRGGAGGPALLQTMSAPLGYEAVILQEVLADGGSVSSTRIRALIGAGDMALAARLLGRPYRLSVRGKIAGGFVLESGRALPPDGAYLGMFDGHVPLRFTQREGAVYPLPSPEQATYVQYLKTIP